jgi:hypothetical protein
VSCSVHDVIRFEKKGIPTVNIGTDAFIDEAEEQSRLLGMPDYETVWLPHPVAILTTEDIQALARETAERIVKKLTA